jgi:hypothetical protein
LEIAFLIAVGITSGFIIYQDITSRRINLMLTLALIALIIVRYAIFNARDQFLQNVLFCLLYFLLSYMILRLYFYLKGKSKEKIIDSKIGWGDVVLLFAVGCTIEPEKMILFFTITFIFALVVHAMFSRAKRTVPLAAYLMILYNAYLIFF